MLRPIWFMSGVLYGVFLGQITKRAIRSTPEYFIPEEDWLHVALWLVQTTSLHAYILRWLDMQSGVGSEAAMTDIPALQGRELP